MIEAVLPGKLLEFLARLGLKGLLRRRTARERLAQEFVGLLDALVQCHQGYAAYVGASSEKDAERLRLDWALAVSSLGARLHQVRYTVVVEDPEVFEALSGYHYPEGTAVAAVMPRPWTRLPRKLSALLKELEDYSSSHRLAGPAAGEPADVDFDEALKALTRFMRKRLRLKPEEILAAQKRVDGRLAALLSR